MQSYIQTAWANGLYAFAALIGTAIGVFYGFDGWRGDTASISFQDSPRVKNLLWVLGPGATAFLGDTKALDPDAKKIQVLLAYFGPCLIAALVVIVSWGCIIGIGRLGAVVLGENFGYGIENALGDYFFFGYRHYRAKSDEARTKFIAERTANEANRTARFHAAYRIQLAYSIAAAGAVAGACSLEQKKAVARVILASIIAVIRSYHNDEENSKRFRSNLMLVRDVDDRLRNKLIFVGQLRSQVSKCLELITYDTDEAQPSIALPIADTLELTLPGATTALSDHDGVVVVNDTSKITFRAELPTQIRNEITAYFKSSPIRSFGCVRIIGGGKIVGVVNIDARVTNVFGQSEEEQKRIAEYLLPFCATLGVVFSHLPTGD